MRGVILAGGSGSRLRPLTDITNKHLLPVYDQPMIHYPLTTLARCGVTEVLLISSGRWLDDFRLALGDGSAFGLDCLEFAAQEEPRGIVDALRLAEEFSAGQPLAVALGDNLLEFAPEKDCREFAQNPSGARIFLTEVDDASGLGVALMQDGEVHKLIEKPQTAISNQAIIGLYLYDNTLFRRISGLAPSDRGEYEITDLNNDYLQSHSLSAHRLSGWWRDCGTFEDLLDAANLVREGQTQSDSKSDRETKKSAI